MSERGSRPDPAERDGVPPVEPHVDRSVAEPRGSEAPSRDPSGDERGDESGKGSEDPLRGSRTSGIWAAVLALVVLLVLLSVFVLQNTQPVEVSYFGWQGEAPLAAALLIAVAAGLLIAVVAGSLRILQLRRRVRRERKR